MTVIEEMEVQRAVTMAISRPIGFDLTGQD